MIGSGVVGAFTPRQMMKLSFDLMQQSANVFRFFLPAHDAQIAWQEFQNKLQTFTLFEYVDSVLDLPAAADVPLSALVAKLARLEPFLAVWAAEGIGHYHAERSGVSHGLLNDSRVGAAPEKSLIALHAGMGLSFANRVLETVPTRSAGSDLQSALQRFFYLCNKNSIEGYAGVAHESLGLVARNLYPHLVLSIDQELSSSDERLAGLFWHGVGRALYFAPTNFLPCSSSFLRAIEMAEREPVHDLGRTNAMAGLTWAMNLVNLRHPEVMENFLKQYGDQLCSTDAFSNGVSSSIVVWQDSAGNDSSLSQFRRHRPDPSTPRLVELWYRYVRAPSEDALQHFHPVLKRHSCLEEVFRYQSLSTLVARLEA